MLYYIRFIVHCLSMYCLLQGHQQRPTNKNNQTKPKMEGPINSQCSSSPTVVQFRDSAALQLAASQRATQRSLMMERMASDVNLFCYL